MEATISDAIPEAASNAAPSAATASSTSYRDPRTYGALLYMLLSLVTGIFYFTWTVTGHFA